MLSRYQDRVDVLADPVLEQLLAEYAAEVNGAGHAVSRKWPYSYGALGDGTRLDDTLRALYDEFADERNGELPSPFTLEGAKLFARLAERAGARRARRESAGSSRACTGIGRICACSIPTSRARAGPDCCAGPKSTVGARSRCWHPMASERERPARNGSGTRRRLPATRRRADGGPGEPRERAAAARRRSG